MYRVMAMLKRQPHLSYEDFVAHYENWHAPWGYRTFCRDHVRRYVRNYVQHPKDGPEGPYDVITEFWFNNEDDFKAWRRFKLEHPEAGALDADERSFFNRDTAQVIVIEPVEAMGPVPETRPEPGTKA